MSWRVVTERSSEVCQGLVDELPHAFQYCTDGFSVYQSLNYHLGLHLVAYGKSQTFSVEAGNSELRHYIKALARKTRCFSKLMSNLIKRVKLFIHCWNRRQLYRRLYPKYSRPLFAFYHLDI